TNHEEATIELTEQGATAALTINWKSEGTVPVRGCTLGVGGTSTIDAGDTARADVEVVVGTGGDDAVGGEGAVYEIRWTISPIGAVGGGSVIVCNASDVIPPFSTMASWTPLQRWPEGQIKGGVLHGTLYDEFSDDRTFVVYDRVFVTWD